MKLALLLWLALTLGCAVGFCLCSWLTAGKLDDERAKRAAAYKRGRAAGLAIARADEWDRTLANTEPADLRRWIPRDRGIREALEN